MQTMLNEKANLGQGDSLLASQAPLYFEST